MPISVIMKQVNYIKYSNYQLLNPIGLQPKRKSDGLSTHTIPLHRQNSQHADNNCTRILVHPLKSPILSIHSLLKIKHIVPLLAF